MATDHTIKTLKDYAPLARTGAKMVADSLKVASTFNRDFESEFGGKRGQTVNVKIPAALIARSRDEDARTEIVSDSLVQDTFPVRMSGFAYNAITLTEGDLAYRLEDFAAEVLAPQTDAVADYIENESIQSMKALDDAGATGGTVATGAEDDAGNPITVPAPLAGIVYDKSAPDKFFVRARKALVDQGLPAAGLWAAVGTEIYADLLEADVLTDASQSGSSAALREAQTGKVRGFTVVEAPMLDENEVVFYGRHSFTLVVRAPRVPEGAAKGASVSAGGFAARYVRDYESRTMEDRSTVATFVKAQNIPVWKVERDYTAGTAAVNPKPSALRVPDVSVMDGDTSV